jgi:2-oxoglutarate dehydrogenase complex dehydrogenase (E1) component-like enzyme
MFTQPLMYKKIRGHKNAHQRYVEQLLTEGSVDQATVRRVVAWCNLLAAVNAVLSTRPRPPAACLPA